MTIRARIENRPIGDPPPDLWPLFVEGNLIPRDEHDAAIAAARRKGAEDAIDTIRNSHRLSGPVCEVLVKAIRADQADMGGDDG